MLIHVGRGEVSRTVQWGKGQCPQKAVLGQLDVSIQLSAARPLPHTTHGNDPEGVTDPKGRAQAIKLLGENAGVSLCDLALGEAF